VPEEGLDEPLTIVENGITRTQMWHYPSRSECLACHNSQAGFVLGFHTAQLNYGGNADGTGENQIQALSRLGYFDQPVTNSYTLPALAHATNTASSLDHSISVSRIGRFGFLAPRTRLELPPIQIRMAMAR
jgi:hypothetical protein